MQSMSTSAPVKARTNTTRVYDELREAIISGRLEPGQRLRTAVLAQSLNTSRTPVREALVQLEADGLVGLEPRRGAVVRPFQIGDLLDLYEVRALLESHAAARAAVRASDSALAELARLCEAAEREDGTDREATYRLIAWNSEFHAIIVEAADSPRLTGALRAVAGIPVTFKSVFWSSPHQRQLSLTCHREIRAALASRSPERAEAAMRLHVLSAKDYLIEVMDERRP